MLTTPPTPVSAPPEPGAASTPAAPAAPPPSRADLLFAALYAARFDADAVAASGVFSILEIIDLAADPAFQARVAAVHTLARTRHALRAADVRAVAMTALEAVIAGSDDLIEKRRAAAALLRAAAPLPADPPPYAPADTPPRRRAPAARDDAPHPAESDPPAPTRTPAPHLTPDQVADLVIHAATRPDDPEPDSGLATIAAFAAEDCAADAVTLHADPDDPAELAEAIETLAASSLRTLRGGSPAWPSRPPTLPCPSSNPQPSAHPAAALTARLFRATYLKQPGVRLELSLTLTRSPASRAPDCWLISHLEVAPLAQPP